MKFEEFMKLSVGDGVIVDGYVGTVTDLNDTAPGDTMDLGDGFEIEMTNAHRELAVTYIDKQGKTVTVHPLVYTDYPDETHNRSVLNRLQEWDPFAEKKE